MTTKDETKKEIDIHNRDARLRSAYRLLKESELCEENKELILDFIKHKKTSKHIERMREAKGLIMLRILAETWGKPLSNLKPKERDEKSICESIFEYYFLNSQQINAQKIDHLSLCL